MRVYSCKEKTDSLLTRTQCNRRISCFIHKKKKNSFLCALWCTYNVKIHLYTLPHTCTRIKSHFEGSVIPRVCIKIPAEHSHFLMRKFHSHLFPAVVRLLFLPFFYRCVLFTKVFLPIADIETLAIIRVTRVNYNNQFSLKSYSKM